MSQTKRTTAAVLAALIAATAALTSCGSQDSSDTSTVSAAAAGTEAPSDAAHASNAERASGSDTSAALDRTDSGDTEPEEETAIPTKEEVAAMRARALAGMKEDDIAALCTLIQDSDTRFENMVIWDNLFSRLSDPEDLYWNYFDETGDAVQIGWGLEGDAESIRKVREEEGLTEKEYEEKYGTPVVTENDMDAEGFAEALEACRDSVFSEPLRTDLQRLADAARLAHKTHDVSCAEEMYHLLHDLDYWLLNYRLDTEGAQIRDKSAIGKYYGVLSSY